MKRGILAVAEYLVTLVKTRNRYDGRKIRPYLPTCQDLPLKNAYAIVTLSALLSACAVAPQKPAVSSPDQQKSQPAAQVASAEAAPAVASAAAETPASTEAL